MKLNDDQKFEAVKYRHNDQSLLSQKLIDIDLKVFFGYITIQLLLGSFLIKHKDSIGLIDSLGIAIVDLVFAVVCLIFLIYNTKRRVEVIDTIKNCNEIMKFNSKDYFKGGISVNGKSKIKKHSFIYGYFIGVIGTIIGILVIIFSNFINC